MRYAIAALALFIASGAVAAPASVEDIEAEAELYPAAAALPAGPALPFLAVGQAEVCGMAVDPLPDALALNSGGHGQRVAALCFGQK